MITKEDLIELKWKPNIGVNENTPWYSYGIEHTTHSNEYFFLNGQITSFPYYSLSLYEGEIWINNSDGDLVFRGNIKNIDTLRTIMECVIVHKYMEEK